MEIGCDPEDSPSIVPWWSPWMLCCSERRFWDSKVTRLMAMPWPSMTLRWGATSKICKRCYYDFLEQKNANTESGFERSMQSNLMGIWWDAKLTITSWDLVVSHQLGVVRFWSPSWTEPKVFQRASALLCVPDQQSSRKLEHKRPAHGARVGKPAAVQAVL